MIRRNFVRSHFEGAAAVAVAVAAAGAVAVASFADAACALPIVTSVAANSHAIPAQPRGPAPSETLSRLPCAKVYSAAAIRAGPTKPAGSPNRSIITAVRSLVLLVTQAPERTA